MKDRRKIVGARALQSAIFAGATRKGISLGCGTVTGMQTPAIYSPRFRSPYVSGYQRFAAGMMALLALAVLSLAAWLTPHPSGVGTHTGTRVLAPCPWIVRHGVPCASCGMTTSFSWFVRGNAVASVYVQPMGFVLATLAAILTVTGLYIAVTGRAAYRVLRFLPVSRIIWSLAALWVVGWAWKIFIQSRGIDGWP